MAHDAGVQRIGSRGGRPRIRRSGVAYGVTQTQTHTHQLAPTKDADMRVYTRPRVRQASVSLSHYVTSACVCVLDMCACFCVCRMCLRRALLFVHVTRIVVSSFRSLISCEMRDVRDVCLTRFAGDSRYAFRHGIQEERRRVSESFVRSFFSRYD